MEIEYNILHTKKKVCPPFTFIQKNIYLIPDITKLNKITYCDNWTYFQNVAKEKLLYQHSFNKIDYTRLAAKYIASNLFIKNYKFFYNEIY